MPTTFMTLNGVAIWPSDAPRTLTKIGKLLETANGGRTFLHRTVSGTPIYKSQWDLSWDGVSETIRQQLETISRVAASVVYVDQHGGNYAVLITEYKDAIQHVAGVTGQTLYYSVQMTLLEI